MQAGLAGSVRGSALAMLTPGIVRWTARAPPAPRLARPAPRLTPLFPPLSVRLQVPFGGNYTFTLAGARGGFANQTSGSNQTGGAGRVITFTAALTAGEVLSIAVGQPGADNWGDPVYNAATVGGGGGATWVVLGYETLLGVAGGGGGAVASRNFGYYQPGSVRARPRARAAVSCVVTALTRAARACTTLRAERARVAIFQLQRCAERDAHGCRNFVFQPFVWWWQRLRRRLGSVRLRVYRAVFVHQRLLRV